MLFFTVFSLVAWPNVLAWETAVCNLPTRPDKGRFTMPNRGINGTVDYYCDNGYWYTGTNPRICQANGQWSGTTGICEKVQCPILSDPRHGRVELTGRNLDDTATVICDEGFIHSYPAAKTQNCLGNNHWSPKRSECIDVHCPELPNPQNGIIQYSGQGYKNTSTIVCSLGYQYTKPESITRTCQGDTTWSLQFDGECKQIHCPILPILSNGHLSANNSHYGVNITITCQPGYYIQGHDTISCQASGTWSEDPGNCIKRLWNPAFLCLLIIPVAVVVIIIVVKCYIKKSRSRQTSTDDSPEPKPEEVPLITPAVKVEPNIVAGPSAHEKLRHHCSLILEDTFEADFKETQSPEYLSFVQRMELGFNTTLKDNGLRIKESSVHVTYVSQKKRMLVMDIECQDREEDIKNALLSETNGPSKHNINIASGTLLFRDDIANALTSEVIKVKHLPHNEDKKVDLDSQYVNLKIISQEELTRVARDELERPHTYQSDLENNQDDVIKDEDVISPGEVKRYVLIRGRAGIGKTTLMQRLMWRWAHGEWATHFKAFFLLNLRVLMAIPTETTLPYLLSRYTVYKIADSGVALEMKWLQDNQKHVGFVLDGLDEVHDFKKWWNKATSTDTTVKEPLLWAFSLMKKECIKGSTIIVTSRPFVALSEVKPLATKTIEIMGLTRERIMEFVEKNVSPERKNMVKQTLRDRPILLSVSAITFYCAALCQVLQDDIGVTDKLTTYTQITAYIMQMFMCRTAAMTETSSCLRALCKLAYSGLMKRTKRGVADLIFGSQDMQNMTQCDVDNAKRSGLFLQTEIPVQPNSEVKKVLGEFTHLSIQEFLAMAGLLMQSPADVKEDLKTLSTSGQFNMGLLFLYGLAFDTTSDTIRELMQAISGNSGTFAASNQMHIMLKNTILEIPDQLQVLQMVHESQLPEIAQKVGLEKFGEEVQFSNTKLTVVDVLAVVFLLRHHPTASTVCLKDVGLDEVSCKELGQFLKSNGTVTTVQLYDDGIVDTAVAHLAKALGQNHTLQKLVIESKRLTDKAMISLADALKINKSLTDLRIEGLNVSEKGMQQFASALETNDTLTHLKIVTSSLTNDAVAVFAAALPRNHALADLKIISREWSSKGVEFLAAALKENSSLTKLLLGWPTVDSEAADRLIEALDINMTVSLRLEFPDCDGQMTRKKLQEHERVQLKLL